MIHITDTKNCCGCSACASKCPKACIQMKRDSEGFLYPDVDTSLCIECGLCEKVCPELNPLPSREPYKVMAMINPKEEIRLSSSSGGSFSALAEMIIRENGVVFGAAFDSNWMLKHICVEDLEDLNLLRGSKYLQSDINHSYSLVESFLKQGRKVLFSGSPCQVAGLKKYLRKEYVNLLTVDFVCHGVPSPKVWEKYLYSTVESFVAARRLSYRIGTVSTHIERINFRDKRHGWRNFNFTISLKYEGSDGRIIHDEYTEPYAKNPYMRAFLHDVILRPSCYSCSAKSGKSHSDLTIADLWGVENIVPHIDDDKGVSLFIINQKNVLERFPKIKEFHNQIEISYSEAKKYNKGFTPSMAVPKERDYFFKHFESVKILKLLWKVDPQAAPIYRLKQIIKRLLNKK